jgi:hypothetical protein
MIKKQPKLKKYHNGEIVAMAGAKEPINSRKLLFVWERLLEKNVKFILLIFAIFLNDDYFFIL